MTIATQTREITINLRARTRQRQLIDQAAELQGKTRSEFMLEAACAKAQEVLLGQTAFVLDQRRFKRFVELLDQPIEKNRALAKLLNSRSPWEK